MTAAVRTEVQSYVATVTIDRPPVNAMTRVAFLELRDAIRALNGRNDVRVAILTGAGRAFSAGIDMKVEFVKRDPSNLLAVLEAIEETATAIETCDVPVIGAINGVALAGGFVLAGACDILVASDRAQFGIPEVLVGIVGGAERLRRLVPATKARTLAFTGQNITAQDLHSYGAIEKVVPGDKLMAEAQGLAEVIASRSPLAVRGVKKAQYYLDRTLDPSDGARYQFLMDRELFATEDAAEAVDAFFAGRKPQFKGR